MSIDKSYKQKEHQVKFQSISYEAPSKSIAAAWSEIEGCHFYGGVRGSYAFAVLGTLHNLQEVNLEHSVVCRTVWHLWDPHLLQSERHFVKNPNIYNIKDHMSQHRLCYNSPSPTYGTLPGWFLLKYSIYRYVVKWSVRWSFRRAQFPSNLHKRVFLDRQKHSSCHAQSEDAL